MPVIGGNHLKSVQPGQYFVDLSFTTRVDAGTVAGVAPDFGSDLAVARTGNGVYTITFGATKKPLKCRAWANIAMAAAGQEVKANCVYNATTGVLTVYLWDTSGGTADNTASMIIDVLMLCSRSIRAA